MEEEKTVAATEVVKPPVEVTRSEVPNTNSKMTIGNWLVTYLVTSIPLIGIIMLFVWAFGDGTNSTKQTWAKATLIWIAISLVLVIGFYVMLFGALFATGSMSSY